MANLKDLRSFGQVSWNLVLAIIVINVSVFSFGFDQSVFSTIQAMDGNLSLHISFECVLNFAYVAYERQFGTYNPTTEAWAFTAEHLSFLNSFGLPAKCIGAAMGLLVAEKFGRRPSYIAMQFIVIIGIAVSYSAQNFGQALAGRMIVQCFVGWDNFLAPMFLAEISPPALRGGIVVVYVFAHILGSLICSFVTLATASYEGDSSWQIPLASMFTFPLFVLVFFWFIPESPRWLVRKGQNERAIKHLCWLQGSSFSKQEAEVEVNTLHRSIQSDMETKGQWTDFLKGSNRVRLDITFLFNENKFEG